MSGSAKKRNIVHDFEWDQARKRNFADDPRADEILADWEERIARHPDMGYAVPGAPDYLGIPLHMEKSSYLAIYWYDEEAVYFVGMVRVPRGPFGDYPA